MTEKPLNNMCLGCQHLGNACEGTTQQVWTGCILKEQPPDVVKNYIDKMTIDAALLNTAIDAQAAEARRDDLDDDEIINNRFL